MYKWMKNWNYVNCMYICTWELENTIKGDMYVAPLSNIIFPELFFARYTSKFGECIVKNTLIYLTWKLEAI